MAAAPDPKTCLYNEINACLKLAIDESRKNTHVNIMEILNNVELARVKIGRLTKTEKDPLILATFKHLSNTLENHKNILVAKIKRLRENDKNPTKENNQTGAKLPRLQQAEPEDDQSKRIRCAINDTILSKTNTGQTIAFSDVIGLKEAKQTLKEAIIMPLQYPHLFTGSRKPWKCILLYGPPGTGKTRLAQAVASEIQSTFYCVSSSDLISSWVGESEKLIKELFQHAVSQQGHVVIFIDEIDSICRTRSSREDEHTRRVKTELLRQMEGVDGARMSNIFLMCATNCPWELDTAFLRRFQKRIYIPLPDGIARRELIQLHTKDNRLQLNEKDWCDLVKETDGYSGSDIAAFTLGALFEPIRALESSKHWIQTIHGQFMPCPDNYLKSPGVVAARMTDLPPARIIPQDVTMQDFRESLKSHGNTVAASELTQFETFKSQR